MTGLECALAVAALLAFALFVLLLKQWRTNTEILDDWHARRARTTGETIDLTGVRPRS